LADSATDLEQTISSDLGQVTGGIPVIGRRICQLANRLRGPRGADEQLSAAIGTDLGAGQRLEYGVTARLVSDADEGAFGQSVGLSQVNAPFGPESGRLVGDRAADERHPQSTETELVEERLGDDEPRRRPGHPSKRSC